VTSIQIDQRRPTRILFAVTWAGGAIVTARVCAVVLHGAAVPPTPSDWLKLGFAGVTLFGLLGYASYRIGFCRLQQAELTEEALIGRSLFSDRTVLWDDVGAVVLREPPEDKKVAWQMEVVTVDGQSMSLIIPAAQGQQVNDWFQDILLCEDWKGAPQAGVINAGYIVLGLAVAAFGLWWDIQVVRDWQAGKLWQMQNQNDGKRIVVTLALAVIAVPGGIAGLCYGLYHHIRRPIVTPPGFRHRVEAPIT